MLPLFVARIERLTELMQEMMLLRATRDFAKQERAQAPEENRLAWETVYHTTLRHIALVECDIGDLLPSGQYQYTREIPEG